MGRGTNTQQGNASRARSESTIANEDRQRAPRALTARPLCPPEDLQSKTASVSCPQVLGYFEFLTIMDLS